MAEDSAKSEVVGQFWSQRTKSTGNWWGNKPTRRNINMRLAGDTSSDVGSGFLKLVRDATGGQTQGVGVSVGCGTARKEMQLVETGIVSSMVCYDLAEARIANAREEARARKLDGCMDFRTEDVFAMPASPQYDLVHWNNSLHHMFDVPAAVAWSYAVLKPGGFFIMDDYVGANRLQISNDDLAMVNSIREPLPARLFENPRGPLPRKLSHADLEYSIRKDPSEAVDAARTLPAIRQHFPDASVYPTGGIGYFIALNGIYPNFDFDNTDDRAMLAQILLIDQLYTDLHPESTLYAVVIAQKR